MVRKKRRISKAKKYRKLILSAILAIAFFALLFYIFWLTSAIPEHLVYVFSENAKQGDTVLIKVSGKYPSASGQFNNQKIDFFRSGLHSEWVAYLGIDANSKPGKYKILVEVFLEKLEKEINIEVKNFESVKLLVTKEMISQGYTAKKVVENVTQNDNPTLNQILERFTPEPYFTDSFTFPLGKMQVSGLDFGQIVNNQGYETRHYGVDLRASEGTKVYAINTGKIVLVKDLLNYGKTIIIDHGLGIYSLYLHLSEYQVSENENVKKDQVIALSGNTGYSVAPHLHFSIRANSARVNPISFIETTKSTDDSFNLANIGRAFDNFLKSINL